MKTKSGASESKAAGVPIRKKDHGCSGQVWLDLKAGRFQINMHV